MDEYVDMRFASTHSSSPPVPSCDTLLDQLRKRIQVAPYEGGPTRSAAGGAGGEGDSVEAFERSSFIRDLQEEEARRGLKTAVLPTFSQGGLSKRTERLKAVVDALYGTTDYGKAGLDVVLERADELEEEADGSARLLAGEEGEGQGGADSSTR
jgi:hypothetical protein